MRHDNIWNSGIVTDTLCDDGHQHDVIRVNRGNVVLLSDSPNNSNVALDVELDLVVWQVDHRDDTIVFLVLVFNEYGKRVTDLRLMENALSRKCGIPLQSRLDFAAQPVPICLSDWIVTVWMIFLANQMDCLTCACESSDNRPRPEIAPGSFEEPSVKQADHVT
jgi:hypothetical protein